MRYLKTFSLFENENATPFWSGYEAIPEWKLLSLMGWKANPGKSVVVYHEEHPTFTLTAGGYVRDYFGSRTGGGGENIQEMFAYLINRFKKKDLLKIKETDLNLLFLENPRLIDFLWDMPQLKSNIISATGISDPKGEALAKTGLTTAQIRYLNSGVKKEKASWTFNEVTGKVDIEGSFISPSSKSGFRGIKFGVVTGYFSCIDNSLASLEGAPDEIGGYFDCANNNLLKLEGMPGNIGGGVDVRYNKLESLEGSPRKIKGNFAFGSNPLKNLKGGPEEVRGRFEGSWYGGEYEMESLEGAPKIIEDGFDVNGVMVAEWSLEGIMNRLDEMIGWQKEDPDEYYARKIVLLMTILDPIVLSKKYPDWFKKMVEDPKIISRISKQWATKAYEIIGENPDIIDTYKKIGGYGFFDI